MATRYRPLPDRCWIEADEGLGQALLAACSSLSTYDDEDLYDPTVQAEIRRGVRRAAPAGFDALIRRIEGRLAEPPFALVVRGIPFPADDRLFIAACRALGEMIAPPLKKPRAQLVHRIQPATDLKSAKGAYREAERLHTDCADWPEPSRLIAMTCARPDPSGGGDSLLLDMESLAAALAEGLGEESVATLRREAVPWRMAAYQGGDIVWQPVLGEGSLRWRRYTIDAALDGGAALPAAMIRLLDAAEGVIESTGRTCCFRLAEGDLLVMDNHRAIHGRTALGGSPQVSGRLMLRSWIRPGEAPGGAWPAGTAQGAGTIQ